MNWQIHIQGQVQGVGFRPFVFLLAQEYDIKGCVSNTRDGVRIEIKADENLAEKFYQDIVKNAPVLSKITGHSITNTGQKYFDNFQIIHSEDNGQSNLLVTPDFAICKECKTEIHDLTNRRYYYPFITCTNCGPRYSIVSRLPYDRINTKMDVFQMCPTCMTEYNNPHERRYYSQTNSCPACAIELSLLDKNENEIANGHGKIVDQVVSLWEDGKIVAIKGIGGYLLTCDANNSDAIIQMRKRKHRPSKPFAVMILNVASIYSEEKFDDYGFIQKELQNEVAPIVLLDIDFISTIDMAKDALAPNLNQLGVMLPYTPLYELLLRKFKKPIVATSGNISNSPIIFDDEKAFIELSHVADFILSNNRDIVVPQDDSVVKFSFFKNQKIILRRSRGLAPTYIHEAVEFFNKSILATGSVMKSTFSFLHQGNTYISQYLGDLENFDTQENYKYTVEHFLTLLKAKPEIILLDKHPDYYSTHFGKELADTINVPTIACQHHVAHFGAIIGEHNLVHSAEPILGVVWDGTGLGDDNHIWGGEFFKYENYNFLRCYYFDYFDFILGDKMPREPRVSALSACWDVMGAEQFLKAKFNDIEWKIYSKLLDGESSLQTSSVGRIFDAVASLLGIMDVQTYEGEAAMQLELMALQYFKEHGLSFSSSYFMEGAHYYRIPTKSLMMNIVIDLKKGKSENFIAAKFHFSLMKIIKIVANNLKIKRLAFSGGVFQNGLLVDLIQHHLKNDFDLFFHKQLSPNDENISYGQLVCYEISQHQDYLIKNKTNENVLSNSW